MRRQIWMMLACCQLMLRPQRPISTRTCTNITRKVSVQLVPIEGAVGNRFAVQFV